MRKSHLDDERVGGAFEERSDCCSLPFVAMEVARDDHELAPVGWKCCIDRLLVEMQSRGIGHDCAQPVGRRLCQASGSHARLRIELDDDWRASQVPIAEAPDGAPRGVETDTARDSPARLAGERPFGRRPDLSGCVREPLLG